MQRVRNKIVFISGASSGIGEACAHVFAEAGATLILAARRGDRLQALADHLKEKHGDGKSLPYVGCARSHSGL